MQSLCTISGLLAMDESLVVLESIFRQPFNNQCPVEKAYTLECPRWTFLPA